MEDEIGLSTIKTYYPLVCHWCR